MDLTVIFTVVATGIGSVAAIIGSNISLMSWLRADMKTFETKIETNMKSFENKIETNMKSFENKIETNMKSFETKIETKLDAWKDQITTEMKDFHGRLERQDAEHKASMQNIDFRFKHMQLRNRK